MERNEAEDKPKINSHLLRKENPRMPLANLLMSPDQFKSEEVQEIERRLGAAGILSMKIAVEGAGDPEMDLDGVSYMGSEEIEQGISAFLATR